MPMFMLISGYLSKKQISIKKAIKDYLIPYIFFDLLYIIWEALRGIDVSLNILFPTYVYWYILALFIMRIMIAKINMVILPVLFGILSFASVVVTEHVWSFMALGRVILLFGIFYIGYRCPENALKNVRNHRALGVSVGIICLLLELALLYAGITDVTWATHDYSSSISDYLLKYIFIFVFTIGMFFFLAVIMPNKSIVLARWGRNSILVYLIHPFFVDIEKAVANRLSIAENTLLLIIFVVAAVIITDVLSMDIFKDAYNNCINKIAKILKLS